MIIALTDCYASNTALPEALEAAGHETVHVMSSETPPPCFTYSTKPRCKHGSFVVTDKKKTAAALQELGVHQVLAGSEAGVALADVLARDLGLPGNDPDTTAARRDKAQMQRNLADSGLKSVASWRIEDARELDALRDAFPAYVVCKPLDSFGNDGVQFFRIDSLSGWEELREAVRRQLGGRTQIGTERVAVLIQEHLVGTEVVVNTVSQNGTHVVTDCWEYTKLDVHGQPDRVSAAVSVCPTTLAPAVLSYARECLDALGITHGPAHAEFFLTDDGPVLMEVAARLSGADTASHAHASMGVSQIDALVADANGTWDWQAREAELPRTIRHVAMYYLTSSVSGRFKDFPKLATVQKLSSFWKFMPRVESGDLLRCTHDEFSEPGMISLRHQHRSVLWRDLLTLHYLDGDGFYGTEPGA